MTTRSELIYLAKIAELADRYEDMVQFMKEAVSLGGQLNTEERNLQSLAYQCTINSRQSMYQQLRRMLKEAQIQAQVDMTQVNKIELIQSYMTKIRVEIEILIYQLVNQIDQHLLKAASTSEDEVVYLKMKCHNLSKLLNQEIGEQIQRQEIIDLIINSYQQAYDIALDRLKPTNLVRLGLVLNYSVFCYEYLNDYKQACSLLQQAIDHATIEMDHNENGLYKDALSVVDLLRDNLALWMSEQDDNMIQQQNI